MTMNFKSINSDSAEHDHILYSALRPHINVDMHSIRYTKASNGAYYGIIKSTCDDYVFFVLPDYDKAPKLATANDAGKIVEAERMYKAYRNGIDIDPSTESGQDKLSDPELKEEETEKAQDTSEMPPASQPAALAAAQGMQSSTDTHPGATPATTPDTAAGKDWHANEPSNDSYGALKSIGDSLYIRAERWVPPLERKFMADVLQKSDGQMSPQERKQYYKWRQNFIKSRIDALEPWIR